MVKTTLYLTERQYAGLKELCLFTGVGLTEAVRRLLDPALEKALIHERERYAREQSHLRNTNPIADVPYVEGASPPETPHL